MKSLVEFQTRQDAVEYYIENGFTYEEAHDFVESNWEE